MFKVVRRLTEALECLVSATEALRGSVVEARDWSASQGNVEARIEELERERHLFQAEIHGELLKAQAEYRKAGNAEKRAQNARDVAFDDDEGASETMEELALRLAAYGRTVAPDETDNGPVRPMHVPLEEPASVIATLKAHKRSR